jgi:hypothetical protein
MTKIVSSPNCGNSPKMQFLKEFNIAFAKGNVELITESVTDDIVWNIIGDRKIEGKEKFTEELEKMKSKKGDRVNNRPNLISRKRRSNKRNYETAKRKKICVLGFLQI